MINAMLKNSFAALQSHKKRRDIVDKKDKVDEEKEWKEYYTIEKFNFYGRGLFIVFVHTLENEFKELLKRKEMKKDIKNKIKQYQASYDKSFRKLSVLHTLIDVGLIAYEKLENNKGLTLFNDDIEISE
jgi:hypothetical protein